MSYQPAFIYSLSSRFNLAPLKSLAAQTTLRALLRITAYYADGRAWHSAATLIDERGKTPRLEVVYEGLQIEKALIYPVNPAAWLAVQQAITQAGFDGLRDQDDLPKNLITLWRIERAAGTFYHGLVLSPHKSIPPYSRLINAIDAHLPDAVREMSG
jgi:hypothetical protein